MLPESNSQLPIPPDILKRIIGDPKLLEEVNDRVYKLLQEDFRQQQERSKGYGRKI